MTHPAPGQRCYRHAEREAYISCQRCERPICPQCMNDASVGFQCPECVKAGAASIRQPRTAAGGAVQSRPGIVTMSLIGLNLLVFLLQLVTGDDDGAVFREGAMLGATAGTHDGEILTGVADGAYWRLITAAFLHNDLIHLGFNMLALYWFGPFIERALGTWRFLTVYLVTALVASAFVYVLTPANVMTVGASGAIFGLFAIAFVLLLRAGQDVRTLLALLAINAVLSLRGGVSWQGHLGGFVAGLIYAVAVAYAPRERRQVAQLVALTVLVIGSIVAVVWRTAALT